jgi:hypothetical protein
MLLGLFSLSGKQVLCPGLFLALKKLLVPFVCRFIPGLISELNGTFEFIGAFLCGRIRVINKFLTEVCVLLK